MKIVELYEDIIIETDHGIFKGRFIGAGIKPPEFIVLRDYRELVKSLEKVTNGE